MKRADKSDWWDTPRESDRRWETRLTLELTGREHKTFNQIGEDNDESHAIERSCSMRCYISFEAIA